MYGFISVLRYDSVILDYVWELRTGSYFALLYSTSISFQVHVMLFSAKLIQPNYTQNINNDNKARSQRQTLPDTIWTPFIFCICFWIIWYIYIWFFMYCIKQEERDILKTMNKRGEKINLKKREYKEGEKKRKESKEKEDYDGRGGETYIYTHTHTHTHTERERIVS